MDCQFDSATRVFSVTIYVKLYRDESISNLAEAIQLYDCDEIVFVRNIRYERLDLTGGDVFASEIVFAAAIRQGFKINSQRDGRRREDRVLFI